MIELYSPKECRDATIASISDPYAIYVFLTEEKDIDTIDWLAIVKEQSKTNLNSSIPIGSALRQMGVTDSNLWACYVPNSTVKPYSEESKDVVLRRMTHFLASEALTFKSKLDAPPVQCLVLAVATRNAPSSEIPNNGNADQLHRLVSDVSASSLYSCSVGLRDSDAEIILLSDEFKKDQEYRISDVELDVDFRSIP